MTDEPGAYELHVEDTGNPDGPPVLFLHGFMSSNLQWEPNRHRLGDELRLLLTEQPGHGGSPGPDDSAAYRADSVLDQLDHIRNERSIDRWWLVGQSLGGAMLIRYALRHPDRVAGLVFTNSRAVFGLVGKQAGDQDGGGPPAEPTRDQIRALPYHPSNASRLPADLKARMIEAADSMPLTVFRHLPSGGPWHSTDDLHRLQVPTLLINGRFEKAFQPCVEQAMAAIDDLQVVNLDGGHSVNIDQPEAFNQAIMEFISSR
ncbi:MAG: alpha/beta hydrolase [Actinomycetia bacterium]|nr:alpha/beta hydrolase [Actinomycetes bacterium]MCP5031050.1 alpha/beta hydrolase [Actinomycetes bacterium]